MVNVTIHHTDERDDEVIAFDSMDAAIAYVEEYYGDCDIEQKEDRIEVVY